MSTIVGMLCSEKKQSLEIVACNCFMQKCVGQIKRLLRLNLPQCSQMAVLL